MALGLSVVINAQDSEKDLPKCLASVKTIADEIVVIDQGSIDHTSEIAKKFGAKVFNHKSVPYVEIARNFAIGKAMGKWVLILDPDEEIPESLAKKIKEEIKKNSSDYFRIPRKNIIFGKWVKHSRWWPDANIRLFRKGFVSWNEIIHNVPMTQGVGSDFESKEDYAIIHHHYNSIDEFFVRMGRYTTHYAESKISQGYKFSWKDLTSKPAAEFFSRYFYGEGYKDGVHGLALALLQSFSELLVYLKIWEKEKYIDHDPSLDQVIDLLRSQEKDLHYWQNDASYKETGSLRDRIRRKLKI